MSDVTIAIVQDARNDAALSLTCKKNLLTLLEAQAAMLCMAPETRARKLVEQVCMEFEARAFDESPARILNSYKQQLELIDDDQLVQWRIPLDRRSENMMQLTSKAYGLSASDLAGYYLAAGIFGAEPR